MGYIERKVAVLSLLRAIERERAKENMNRILDLLLDDVEKEMKEREI